MSTLLLLLSLYSCTKESQDSASADELCDDGVDNDGDGDVDCLDADCPACVPELESDCSDGVDEDQDGDADCADSDCASDPACIEDCGDGLDNDLDGQIDCADSECEGIAPCIEDCADGVDNDLDGLTDCADTQDCEAACIEADFCEDGVDNDQDGLTDCEDVDCTEVCAEDCENGVDDDGDGFVDCLDNECSPLAVCDEDCFDGVDNDGNGRVDCEDAFCSEICAEDCENGVDDDSDGYLDCEDDECWGTDACVEVKLQVTGGTMSSKSGYLSSSYSSAGGYGYTFGAFDQVNASGVSGTLVIDRGSSQESCNWSVGQASFEGMGGYYYGGAITMKLLNRSSVSSSGACGLSSDALPQYLQLSGRNGSAFIDSSGTLGVLWYGGSAVQQSRGGSSTFNTSPSGFSSRWSSYTLYQHQGLAGSEWISVGL